MSRITILFWLIDSTAFLFSTGFLLVGSLFTPNIVEQFLWLLICYLFLKLTIEKLRFINFTVIASLIVVSLIALPFGLPVLPPDQLTKYSAQYGNRHIYPFARWENGKVYPISQVFADMTGWQELTGYAAKAYDQLSADEQRRCTIFVEQNYGDAGAIHLSEK